MRTFDNLHAMRACLSKGACAPTAEVMENMCDYIDGPIEQASFTALFGAPVYLVERVDDLRMVLSFDEASGRRVSLADAASAGFDIAEWIDDGQFARFVTIENAEGGPQYLIPRQIADQAGFIGESIQQRHASTR